MSSSWASFRSPIPITIKRRWTSTRGSQRFWQTTSQPVSHQMRPKRRWEPHSLIEHCAFERAAERVKLLRHRRHRGRPGEHQGARLGKHRRGRLVGPPGRGQERRQESLDQEDHGKGIRQQARPASWEPSRLDLLGVRRLGNLCLKILTAPLRTACFCMSTSRILLLIRTSLRISWAAEGSCPNSPTNMQMAASRQQATLTGLTQG